jgi:hypothetical protein
MPQPQMGSLKGFIPTYQFKASSDIIERYRYNARRAPALIFLHALKILGIIGTLGILGIPFRHLFL